MPREQEASYTLSFVKATGLLYSRAVFWERLYAFRCGNRSLLAAIRVVPHNDLLFATYLALRNRTKRPIHRELLPEQKQFGGSTDLVKSMTDLMPQRSTPLPAEIVEKANQLLEQNLAHIIPEQGAGQLVAEHMGEESLGQSSVSCAGCAKGGISSSAAMRGLATMAAVEGEDIGWIYLGQLAHQIIEERAREVFQENSESLPALREDLAHELSRRLYSNPRYLEFVTHLMHTRSGFLSPPVRHFIAFYLECLEQKVREWEEKGGGKVAFWKERLEGEVGRSEAASGGFLPYYEILILGYVKEGELTEHQEDPDRTKRGFRLDPAKVVSSVTLQEVESSVQRLFLKEFVQLYFRHNIERVLFVDELSGEN